MKRTASKVGNKLKNTFTSKYPLATIHLLIGILGATRKVAISKPALCPLFFVDGTFQVLFTYPENVLDWISFLGGLNSKSPLHDIFCNQHYSMYDLMVAMDDFFRKRDAICKARQMGPRERGDRLILSDKNGNPFNLIQQNQLYKIENGAKNRAERFLSLLSGLVGWGYKTKDWAWDKMKIYKFGKGILKPGVASYYKIMMPQNPLSFAITSRENLEYTLENPDTLP